jgi:hypothetical protein
MKNNYSVLFARKNGEVKTIMEGLASSLLKLWGLQGNVPKSCDYIVFDEDGIILAYYKGQGKNMPDVKKEFEGKHVNEFFEGLLEAVKA